MATLPERTGLAFLVLARSVFHFSNAESVWTGSKVVPRRIFSTNWNVELLIALLITTIIEIWTGVRQNFSLNFLRQLFHLCVVFLKLEHASSGRRTHDPAGVPAPGQGCLCGGQLVLHVVVPARHCPAPPRGPRPRDPTRPSSGGCLYNRGLSGDDAICVPHILHCPASPATIIPTTTTTRVSSTTYDVATTHSNDGLEFSLCDPLGN